MASSTNPQFFSLPRWHSKWPFFPSMNLLQLQDLRFRNKWGGLSVAARRRASESLAQEGLNEEIVVENRTSRISRRSLAKSRKKVEPDEEYDSVSSVNGVVMDEVSDNPSLSDDDSKRTQRRTRKKGKSTSGELTDEKVEKKVTRRRKIKKKIDETEDEGIGVEYSDQEEDAFIVNVGEDPDQDLELEKDGVDDISFTYGCPPLVCCFGSAQHAFVPSGRPANRLLDYEIHDRMEDAFWAPENFVRAPGGCASSVALALASLGGRVAFMGKIGDDDYGQSLLYYLNMHGIQTRSVCIDSKRETAVTQMKIGKRGGLKMTCVKPCAEDSLSKSEINIDVLREAKMFYFNTFSLLDRNMRSTTLKAIKIVKKLGGLVFYDLNLPLPLWQSCEEAKLFIQQVWHLADVIELTKQELEFMCGINPSEKFDTRDNDRSKFVHYSPEVIAPLWHESLKVLFVTNGTSKIHYYTKEHDGAVRGMEDAPITPFTGDMSASGDGIVAGLMRMLTVQPHLINDKGYLEQTVKYAINCGVVNQWLETRTRGFPPKEGMEEDLVPDENGIRSITEKEYRTLVPVS